VLDGVGVVWASLLKELLEVVYGQPHLQLAAACGSCDAHHARATYLLAIATSIIGHDYSLLNALLANLTAALGTLPDILESGVGRCLPDVAWGREKFGSLTTGGILDGDGVQPSVVFLTVSASSWNNGIRGMFRVPLLGALAPDPLG
jgi:hypothetical protein